MTQSSVLVRKIMTLESEVERLRVVEVPIMILPAAGYASGPFPLSASGSPYYPFSFTLPRSGLLTRITFGFYVVAPNNGSNYWTFDLEYVISGTSIQASTSAGATANTWTRESTAINGGLGEAVTATTDIALRMRVQSTNSPGAVYVTVPVVMMA